MKNIVSSSLILAKNIECLFDKYGIWNNILDDNIIEHSFPKKWRTRIKSSTASPTWRFQGSFWSTRTMGRLKMSTRSPEKLEAVLTERSVNDVLDRAKKQLLYGAWHFSFW